ncbi:MAG TPA: hypothetical protein DHV62_09595 [Elusimicrobia bacterium]|nr:hypothetical protein [Elusimicrobiota bacterium]
MTKQGKIKKMIVLNNINKTMTKKEFIELTGENPEDVLGNDWENEQAEYEDDIKSERMRDAQDMRGEQLID